MWILKTKGTAKIPDYLQIRDDDFTLKSHIKLHNRTNIKESTPVFEHHSDIDEIISKLEYGLIQKIDEIQ